MININELRRLAQAATPHVGHACKYQDAHWLREGHVDFENADLVMKSETKITLHDETASFIGEQLFNMKHAMENQSA